MLRMMWPSRGGPTKKRLTRSRLLLLLLLLCWALTAVGCDVVQQFDAGQQAAGAREMGTSLAERGAAVAPERVNAALLVGGLIALAVMLGFVGFWRLTTAIDPVESRVREYGREMDLVRGEGEEGGEGRMGAKFTRLLMRLSLGTRLAEALSRADLPFTATEFVFVMVGAAALGFAIGLLRVGLLMGLVLGAIGGFLPLVYLRMAQGRRQRAFTTQLPDMLTLLVGGLRAGHGLSQALQTLADQMPPPTSTEVERVLRAVRLGVPMDRALTDMAERVGTEDARLMVTAIIIQRESGGNLAETLDTISDTLRDRVRVHRELMTLTAQQRLSGIVLAVIPVALAMIIFMINPTFFQPFFEPGWPRLLPAAAVVMEIVGYLIIRRILDIEV
ncbi:MAG: type II secretion system F family protein [Chloroflexota bacterium]|nr:type II secretion system F family protein [Chloroflexota bacterium]